MVRNAFKQAQLDKEKWLESEKNNEDMSGAMYYCDACEYQKNGYLCSATQLKREYMCLCAKAYNRLNKGAK